MDEISQFLMLDMTNMTIMVLPVPAAGSKPYSHLESVVYELFLLGNQLCDAQDGFTVEGAGFYMDKDGWKCDLKKDIDFYSIRNKFEFPKSIVLSEKNNSIFCTNTWVEIRGGHSV